VVERSSNQVSDRPVRLGLQSDGTGGVGSLGLDLQTLPQDLPEFALARADRVRVQRGALERAPGPKRLAVLTNNTASRTFGADTKYMKVPAHARLLIPKGGFSVRVSVTAVRSAADGYILSNRQPSQTYGVVWFTLNSAGLLKANVRWASGTTTTLTTSALADGSEQHALLVYDDLAGTLTLYLDGDSAATATPGTGLQPAQTAAIDWYFGVEWNPSAGPAAVVANTHFDGKVDAFTLCAFRGIQITAGSPSLLDTLRKHTFREWPNPALPMVLAHYSFSEATGSVAYDRSAGKNHGTYVGASTSTDPVAISRPVGNFAGTFQRANGARTNLVAAGGQLFYETVRSGN